MDLLKDVIRAPFELMRSTDTVDALVGWTLLAIILLVAFVILHLVVGGLYGLIDRTDLETHRHEGVITRKSHRPGTTQVTMTYNPALRMMTPFTYFVPPCWSVRITLDNELEGWMDVSCEQYERLKVHQRLRAEYRVGRLSETVLFDDVDVDLR